MVSTMAKLNLTQTSFFERTWPMYGNNFFMLYRHEFFWKEQNGDVKQGVIENINPYLLILFRNMLKYQASLFTTVDGTSVSFQEMTLEHTVTFLEHIHEDIVSSKGFISRLKRFIWSKEQFCFYESDLDKIVTTIVFFGEFKSWSEFVSLYGNHPFAIEASKPEYGGLFSDLDDNRKQAIKAMVTLTLNILVASLKNSSRGRIEKFNMELIKKFFIEASTTSDQQFKKVAQFIYSQITVYFGDNDSQAAPTAIYNIAGFITRVLDCCFSIGHKFFRVFNSLNQ